MNDKRDIENEEEHEPLNTKEEKPVTTEKVEKKKKSFIEKLRYVKSNITVEPILIGIVIPAMLSRLAIQNLNLDKACRVKLNYSDEICDALLHKKNGTNLTDIEREVQKIVSAIEAWKSIIQTGLPTILILFMGAWSDRTGNRKICILLPIFGEILTCCSNIMSTYFFYEIPVEVTMILEALFLAIMGGWLLLFLGIFSYISDVASEGTWTFRFGMANLCLTAGIPIGTSLSGILLKYLGYYGIFGIAGTAYFCTFLYGVIYLKLNTKKQTEEDDKKKKDFNLGEVINLLKETVTVAFKKRPNNLRIKIILTLLIVSSIYGPTHGERIVTYLFLRYRLKWNAIRYSFYSTYNLIIHSIGALFSIHVMSRKWKFPDAALCLISITSKFAGSILTAFVRTDFEMFLVPLVEILNATTFTSLRSMASKSVSSAELGKMNSLFSLVENLAAFIFDPTYSALYFATIQTQTMSGAVFLFSAAMTIPAGVVLIWMLLQIRKERKQKKIGDLNEAGNGLDKKDDIEMKCGTLSREQVDLPEN